ncbi:gibberellin 20 oxidase 1-D-like [Telopea speciosissima]|uniref:gibberellin 20 oxidase 1-D-like n=1 Tax=Telopea speciosissima TaxID=54955 RepID=UPI001CC64553|nr:gibberellin 20 oxidase 1-D-like [Telopea speciosissima]
MDSSSCTLLSTPSPLDLKDHMNNGYVISNFDSSLEQKKPNIPRKFHWPHGDLVCAQEELREPLIDLHSFFVNDEVGIKQASELVRDACLSHGFFQVINHGVDSDIIRSARHHLNLFFNLPINQKLKAQRMAGSLWGYSGAHADRFSLKLPWKETLSFGYHENKSSQSIVVDYFKSLLGENFAETGLVYQRYCKAMQELSLVIMELLAISLGIDRLEYRRFFKGGSSIMRCNYYPPCQEPGLTLGTGPHRDPTSLTILHQDEVGGLEVFAHNKWKSVRPRSDAFVINIGDTFMALSNGRYKSCLHRAVVNKYMERSSLAFFLCPKEDNVVRPPEDLMETEGPRKYPDFTWSDLLDFTQNHYRADVETLPTFIHWFLSSKQS